MFVSCASPKASYIELNGSLGLELLQWCRGPCAFVKDVDVVKQSEASRALPRGWEVKHLLLVDQTGKF